MFEKAFHSCTFLSCSLEDEGDHSNSSFFALLVALTTKSPAVLG